MKKFFFQLCIYLPMLLIGVVTITNNTTQAQSQRNVQVNANLGNYGDHRETNELGIPGAGQKKSDSLINIVKNFVNWALGLLSFIALLVLLYGGFQMVTAAGNEDKYNAGFTILRQAAVGLAFIALSWFVLSMVFWLLTTLTGGEVGGG